MWFTLCFLWIPLLEDIYFVEFLGGASGKNLATKAGDIRDMDSIPESARSPGEGK